MPLVNQEIFIKWFYFTLFCGKIAQVSELHFHGALSHSFRYQDMVLMCALDNRPVTAGTQGDNIPFEMATAT